ncbi:MAG: aminotransferase class V-fold PLP-dependent enzyme [Flavobacteriales bacterium]|nr:aminotransferase class V-fold PLP-dependent enzyme [Flavobacteriales bacterium]
MHQTEENAKEQLLENIDRQAKVRAQLDPESTLRRNWTEQVTEFAHHFTDHIHQWNGYYPGTETAELALSDTVEDMGTLLQRYEKYISRQGVSPASAGHLGYIPGGGIYTSALADYLAAVTNEYAGIHFAGPGAVAIENACIDWLKQIFGFPQNSVGNLSSGGSIANLIALTSARDKHRVKGAAIEKSVIYTSPHVHHCIQKSLRIIGLEEAPIRLLKLDNGHRIDANELEQTIQTDRKAGLNPFLVIASAGTTDTGAVDPLNAIADLCETENLWFHTDAAYGGFFILCPEKQQLFRGIERADSVVVDPHKGMFLPYGIGAVLVRDREAVMHSNHYFANYMQDAFAEHEMINPADVSPELTKHFRGLRMWLPLNLHGIEPFRAALSEKLLLTQYFRQLLSQNGFMLGPEPDLSVSYFWWPDAKDPDAYNELLMKEIHRDGRVMLSSSRIDGRYVIRIAILAFRTGRNTVEEAMEMVLRCKERVDELM